jgi:hypothetical protein
LDWDGLIWDKVWGQFNLFHLPFLLKKSNTL